MKNGFRVLLTDQEQKNIKGGNIDDPNYKFPDVYMVRCFHGDMIDPIQLVSGYSPEVCAAFCGAETLVTFCQIGW